MEFKDWFVFVLIAGMVIVAFISAATLFAVENDAVVNVNQEPAVKAMFGDIETELNQSATKTNSSMAALIEEEKNPILSTLGFVFNSILAAVNTFAGMGFSILTYIFVFVKEVFGISPIIVGTLMSIIVGSILLAIWSVVRAGR